MLKILQKPEPEELSIYLEKAYTITYNSYYIIYMSGGTN